MKIENRETKELQVYYPNEKDLKYAETISEWTMSFGNMLPKTPEKIMSYFKKENSVLIMDKNENLISHAAIVEEHDNKWIEIGSLVTNTIYQRKGGATTAVKEVIKLAKNKHPDGMVFALANKYSSGLFEKMGAQKLTSSDLPHVVWEPCKNCPNYKLPNEGTIFKCCDTPYNLTNIIKR